MSPFVALLRAALPAVWVLGAAVVLRWVTARWLDPLPKRVLAAFLLLEAVLLAPALLGGKVLLPLHLLETFPPYQASGPELAPEETPDNRLQYDLVLEVVPHTIAVRRSLARGEWPLWNPDVGAGMTILGDPTAHSRLFHPFALLTLPLPVPEAATATAGLRLLVALVFSFLLFRRLLGAGDGPAFFGAVTYGFGGYLVLWLGWPLADSAVGLPLLLYGLLLVAERGLPRDVLLLAVAVYTVVVGGHPETILYVGLLGGAFGLWCLVRARGPGPAATAARFAGAGALALACAAPALLPVADHLPRTHRAEMLERRGERLADADPFEGLRGPDELRGTLRQTVRRLGPMVAPHAQGSQLHGGGRTFWGEGNVYLDTPGFAGTLALLLALAAGVSVKRGAGRGATSGAGRRLPLERSVLWIGVPFVVLALVRFPGLGHLLATAPVLDRSASRHARLTLVLVLFVAYLAVCTLERWRRGELRSAPLVGGGAVTLAVVAAANLGLVPEGLDPGRSLPGLRYGSLALQAGVAAAALAALLAGRVRGPTRGPTPDSCRRAVPVVLALLAFLELAWFFGPANPATPRELFYPPTDTTRFLREHAEGHRVVGMADALRPNVPSVHRLADPRFSNPAKPWRYAWLTSALSRSPREITDVFGEPEHPLYRLLGVRYLVVRDRFRLDPLRRVFEGEGLSIYEPPAPPLPRLFLPERARLLAPVEGSPGPRWLHRITSIEDHGATSLAETLPAGASSWRSRRPEASILTLERPRVRSSAAPEHVRARVRLEEPRLLASSIHQDGGWRLLVDGRRVDTVRTNGVFVGGWLRPGPDGGDRRLDLLYRPRGFVAGMLAAALGLTAGLAWWLPLPLAGRQLPAPSSNSPATAARRGLPAAVRGSAETRRQRLGTS